MRETRMRKYNIKKFEGVQYLFVFLGIEVWNVVLFKNHGWFRLFGVGLCWKRNDFDNMFSSKMGYRKFIKIGKWKIARLIYK